MSRYDHTIVVGGTGMLKATSVELARQSHTLTSIARTEESLCALDEIVSGLICQHHTIAQDYNRISELQSTVRDAIRATGPADLVIAWIHDEAGPVPMAICEVVAEESTRFRFIQVMGSAAADPNRSLDVLADRFSQIQSVRYQQVVLGFRVDSGGSRWLTNDEIADGVSDATGSGDSMFVVGQIRPWELRP